MMTAFCRRASLRRRRFGCTKRGTPGRTPANLNCCRHSARRQGRTHPKKNCSMMRNAGAPRRPALYMSHRRARACRCQWRSFCARTGLSGSQSCGGRRSGVVENERVDRHIIRFDLLIITYDAIIIYIHVDLCIFQVHKDMEDQGVDPNKITYTALITACAKAAGAGLGVMAVDRGLQLV